MEPKKSQPGRKAVLQDEESIAKLKAGYESGLDMASIYDRDFKEYGYSTVVRRIKNLIDEGVIDESLHRNARKEGKNSRKQVNLESFATPATNRQQTVDELLLSKPSTREYSRMAYTLIPISQRRLANYDFARIANYRPNKSRWLPKEVRAKISELENKCKTFQPPELIKKIKTRMLVDIVHNSSRMEGGSNDIGATILVFQEVLRRSKSKPVGVSDEDYLLIRNHIFASEHLLSKISTDRWLNKKTLGRIQGALLIGTIAGSKLSAYREGYEGQVLIGNSTYTPISQQFLDDIDSPVPLNVAIEHELDSILAKAKEINDPFEASFFTLLAISYLQPFYDGNKRTARLCCNFPLLDKGMAPMTFLGVKTDDYLDAMIEFYETGNSGPMAEVFLTSYMNSVNHYRDLIKAANSSDADMLISKQFNFARAITTRVILNQCPIADVLNECVEECIEELSSLSQADCFMLAKKVQDDIKHLHGSKAIVYELEDSEVDSFNASIIEKGPYFFSETMGEDLYRHIQAQIEPSSNMHPA